MADIKRVSGPQRFNIAVSSPSRALLCHHLAGFPMALEWPSTKVHTFLHIYCHQSRSRESVVQQRFNIAVASLSHAFPGPSSRLSHGIRAAVAYISLFSSIVFAREGIGEEGFFVVVYACVYVCLVCVCSSRVVFGRRLSEDVRHWYVFSRATGHDGHYHCM